MSWAWTWVQNKAKGLHWASGSPTVTCEELPGHMVLVAAPPKPVNNIKYFPNVISM